MSGDMKRLTSMPVDIIIKLINNYNPLSSSIIALFCTFPIYFVIFPHFFTIITQITVMIYGIYSI